MDIGRGAQREKRTKEEKIQQAAGRLQERYPRVARYYRMRYQAGTQTLSWAERAGKRALAEKLDGAYVLRTDGQDLSGEEIRLAYILPARLEDAFRGIGSPLLERPIFHQLKHRTQIRIFLCVSAYHLLAAIEQRFLEAGIHTSWWTPRQQLSTHQAVAVVLPTPGGRVLHKL